MKTIRFNSLPENWKKEYLGLKCNTVRIIDNSDVRKEVLRDYLDGLINKLSVEIINTKTDEIFTRLVTDVTKWENMFIISWRHLEG